jgi:probable selenium-dependent hydroxylase accessory protein YqeC
MESDRQAFHILRPATIIGLIEECPLFSEIFSFVLPARVNLVGGGGKTSLILTLLREFAESIPAVYTTTTRIHPPHPCDGLVVISSDNDEYLEILLERAVSGWCPGRRFVVTHLSNSPNLLRGVDASFSSRIDPVLFPVLLNEADGARSMSLKMPRAGEPVLIPDANYLVPVIGLDCLNRPLGPETLFRWEYASQRFKLTEGSILAPKLAASILLHPEGVCRDWTPGMHIIPFINKVDDEAGDELAQTLARELLTHGHFPIDKVVWGSLQNARVASVPRTSKNYDRH